MAESSLPWTDSTGDGGPYAHGAWDDIYRYLFTQDDHDGEGVLEGVQDELVVAGTATPVTVGTGAAVVNGKFYKNTAEVEVAVASPAVSTRIDRVVLRAAYAAMTVRITLVAGVEGGAAPALTQVDGTTWDIPLAQVSITTGGVITVTDEREFCHFATKVRQAMIDAGAVDTTEIADDAITAAKIDDGAVGNAAMADDAIDTAEISDGAVETAQINAGAVTFAKLDDGVKPIKGMIMMWSGTMGGTDNHHPVDPDTTTALVEWHLANGDTVNSVVTPDLRDRFIVAAGSTYALDGTGGAATHTHAVSITADLGGAHTHTGTTGVPNSGWTGGDGATSIAAVAHTHDFTTAASAQHQHGVNGNTGSGSTLPPYYSLVFLCYVGA